MTELATFTILGVTVTRYALYALLGFLAAAALGAALAKRYGVRARAAVGFAVLAGVLGLLAGRAVYCLVRRDSLFFSDMGEFLGLAPLFDFTVGRVSVVGAVLGVALAALACRLLTRRPASAYLDCAVLPGLAYYAFMRFIEPLSGQGYGDLMTQEALCFYPLCRMNDWGDWTLSVSFIEGVLAVAVLFSLAFIAKKCRRSGTLTLYAATLLAATQIIPESLRCDDVLYIFIFARVTHIGCAALLFTALLTALLHGVRNGLRGRTVVMELALSLLGLGVCIGTIFALDKTNLPPLAVYAVLLAALAALTTLNCRRIRKEDLRA